MDDPEAILDESSRGYVEIAVDGAIRFKSTIAGITICLLAPLASIGVQTVGWPDPVAVVVGAGPITVVLLYWITTVIESAGMLHD